MLEDTARDRWPDPNIDQIWDSGYNGAQGAIEEVAGVGNKDLLEYLKTCATGRVEDSRGGIGFDVVRGCLHDVPDCYEKNADTERLEPAKDVCDLSHRWLDDREKDGLDDGNGRDERVGPEGTCGKGGQSDGDLCLE